MTKVKVCGIRRLEDALMAIDLGAWALGFVFHPPSPRFVAPEDAASVVSKLPAGVIKVGVFVDWSLEDVNATVRNVGLDAVQLHGKETPEFARGVSSRETWKAFRVSGDFRSEAVDAYSDCTRILLDTYSPDSAGGTGETFDWSIARRVGERRPVLLAGGLGPDNIEEALRQAAPEGVDVSSGVEAAPGVKDETKLRELFRAVERHDSNERE